MCPYFNVRDFAIAQCVFTIVTALAVAPLDDGVDDSLLVVRLSRYCTQVDAGHARCDAKPDIMAEDRQNKSLVHLTCHRGFTPEWIDPIHTEVWSLTIRKWSGLCLSAVALQAAFPELRRLQLLDSPALKTFHGVFSTKSKIEVLSMHNMTSLHELPRGLVAHAPRLRTLDLRGNALRHIRPRTLRGPPALTAVYLSDNGWDCSDGGLDWLALEGPNGLARSRILDYMQLMCHQRLYKGKPLHKVMDIIRTMRSTCPSPCRCHMTHVVSDAAGALFPLITVDCAALQLRRPPTALPPNTTTVRLERNQIDTIRPMIQNPHYRRVADLYLDYNQITTSNLKELEDSEWLRTFRVLSLRGNALTQVPLFAFDNAFKQNPNIANVYLGDNPWRCDCHYTPKFQELLQKYRVVIKDVPDIRCSQSDENELSLVQINTISRSSICETEPESSLTALDALNVILASLIILVISRFLYDCYSFKTTGRLPWISSILP